jgi:hypothetical protein
VARNFEEKYIVTIEGNTLKLRAKLSKYQNESVVRKQDSNKEETPLER